MRTQKNGRLETLSPGEKRALLTRIYKDENRVKRPGTAPMSYAQERIWTLTQLEPETSAFNITTAYHLSGSLDVTGLEQSFNQIIQRHAVLRTTFANVDGKAVQVIWPAQTMKLAIHDLQGTPQAKQEQYIQQLILKEEQQPFNLTNPHPLFRSTVVRLAEEEHVLILTTHRIVFDGQCWPVLIRELSTFYRAYSDGKHALLPELPLQYADFAVWHRKRLGKTLDIQLAFWREKFHHKVRLLRLPTDYPRSATQSPAEIQTFSLPQELSETLELLSKKEGVSLFVILLAAFQLLLYRYTTQEDFLTFSSVAGRNRPELQQLIGLFANILPLRADLSGNPSFREVLGRVHEIVADAYAHQDLPFDQIRELIQIEQKQPYTSLLQVTFTFWPVAPPTPEWAGITLNPLDAKIKPAEFDIHLHITGTSPALSGSLIYKAGLFQAHTMSKWLEYFEVLLRDIVSAPGQRLSDLFNSRNQAEQGIVTGPVSFLPSQKRFLQSPDLWVNMVEVVELEYALDPLLLERAVRQIFEHHDALRTRFTYDGTMWQQFLPESGKTLPFTYIDLSGIPEVEHDRAVKAALAALQSSVGPLQDALMRVCLFYSGMKRPGYLIFTVHHVVADNYSVAILVEDLHKAYQQLKHGESISNKGAVQLPAKTTSIKTWAGQLETYLQSAKFQQLLSHELSLLPEQRVSLPVDYPEGKNKNILASTAHVQVSLSPEDTNVLLREFPRVYKVWLIDILLTALVQAVTQWSGERWMTIQIVDDGRNPGLPGMEDFDLSRTVGCLFVPGIMMLERSDSNDPEAVINSVKKQLRHFSTYGISIGLAQQGAYHGDAEIQHLSPAELRLNYLGQTSLPVLSGWSPQTSSATEDFVANRRHGGINRNPILLNCTAVIMEGRLITRWEYSENIHTRHTIKRLANDVIEVLGTMTQHYQQQRAEKGEPASGHEKGFVAPRTTTEDRLAGIWAKVLDVQQVGVYDNFFELGGDSLLAMNIAARVREVFEVNLSLANLLEESTVASLAKYIEMSRWKSQSSFTNADLENREEIEL